MRFNGQKHNRGIHCLTNVQDHQVLARARVKGLLIHPSVLDSTGDPAVLNASKSTRRRAPTHEIYSKH
ncbi:MAG TPA: hypothetical protein DHW71_14575 [Gammaproteobacteria bacterium]|nr:hypothetical protein [Gammaproteobacteria bacterium]MEC8009612.1 hypothetical protein [Pseudomonadota bacterium]HBF09562.1 hypothetical protein [Gammaproteobacteria bacterium]HCK94217.1 hypothetical protein [Gammaproteobacteria bacterium]